MRKVVLFLSMMFVLSMGLFASICVITPYQWDKETEVLSLDITVVEDEFVLNSAEAYSNLWIRIWKRLCAAHMKKNQNLWQNRY